jgi:hypothetical protein
MGAPGADCEVMPPAVTHCVKHWGKADKFAMFAPQQLVAVRHAAVIAHGILCSHALSSEAQGPA